MKRTHMHMAAEHSSAAGLRKNAQIMVTIDVAKATIKGIPFFTSENGVVLTTATITKEYFKSVEILSGKGTWSPYDENFKRKGKSTQGRRASPHPGTKAKAGTQKQQQVRRR